MRNVSLFLTGFVITLLAGCRGGWHPSACLGSRHYLAPAVPVVADPARRFQWWAMSWKAMKQHHVIMQQRDYSCGAATLATMLRFYFGDKVTEAELLKEILADLSAEEIEDRQENGLSMDDLFRAAKDRGYLATVYDLELEKLPELEAPIIVRIEEEDYKHFVVVRGVVEDRVFLADPIRGNVRVPVEAFAKQWSGEALFLGKKGFGVPKDHGLAVRRVPPVRNEIQAARRSLYRGT
jgi:predicted double-glycine peptidase